jgi:small conductance mechanosensitive channel
MSFDFDVEWTRIATILAVWAVLWFGMRWALRRLRIALTAHADDEEEAKRVTTVVRAIKHFLSVILIAAMVMLVLSAIGLNIAPLLGAAGIAGIAIGFAAQGIAKDFIRGFSLLVDNQIRVGDAVEIAGKSGIVEEMTVRTVTLRDYEGAVHFVPTGDIRVVTNRAYGFSYALLDVGVGHDADLDRAMAAIGSVASELRADPAHAAHVLEAVEIAGVDQWGESGLQVRARMKVAPGRAPAVRRELLRRLKLRFDRDGISIPSPRLTVVRPAAHTPPST